MSKSPSAETQLKNLRTEHNKVQRELSEAKVKLRLQGEQIQSLLVEINQWTARHDALIAAIGRAKP